MGRQTADRLRDGDSKLSAAGIGSEATPKELEAALGRDVDVDFAIVHRLGGVASEEAIEILHRIAHTAGQGREAKETKDLRKEIKRSLYRLEQRGLVAPPLAVEARPTPAIAAGIEGYVSAFDGRGDRLVWLVKPRPGSVLHLFGVVNDPSGLREVAANRLSRKALREIQEELRRKHEIRLVDVDWRWADFVMHRALDWARALGGAVEGDYNGLRSQLTAEPVRSDLPGPIERMRSVPPPDDQQLVDSAEILLEPEMRTWVLDEDLAQRAIDELVEIRKSPLVLNEAQVTERFDAVNSGAVDAAFGGERRASWQRRLEETAYYFDRTSRPLRAAQAAAAARALGEGHSPADIPFCDIYVRRTLGMYLGAAEKQEEEMQQSSLIVTPDQLRKSRRR